MTLIKQQDFILLKEGDLVYDIKLEREGIIESINDAIGSVTVKNDAGVLHISKISQLVKLDNSTHENSPLEIKVKYFNNDIERIEKISKGDWIDLRSSVNISLKKGEFALVPLGVGMKLPNNYEANIVPRSSTFKNYGIIQTNHFAVIDNSYSGNEDEWKLPVYATRDIDINFNDRICQFRINEKMPSIVFKEVEKLDDTSRGGFGSTGVK